MLTNSIQEKNVNSSTLQKDYKKIIILADDRERNAPILAILNSLPDIDLHIQRLNVGDYQIDGVLTVERKEFNDFLNSIVDGRIFRQAKEIAKLGSPRLILLEGKPNKIRQENFSRQAIQGTMISLSVTWGIPILRSLDAEESVWLMLQAAKQLRRYTIPSAFRRGRAPNSKRQAQTYLLQGLPGIGRTLAIRLLLHFKNVSSIMNATELELCGIDGIGAVKARRIRQLIDSGV